MNRSIQVVSWLILSLSSAGAGPNPGPALPARLALLSDTHITFGTNYALYSKRLARVVDQVNAAQVDLVLLAGDLTQDGKAAELEEFKRQTDRLQAPACHVPGNHDIGNKVLNRQSKPDSVNSWRLRYFERVLGRSFYSRTRAGIRVIGINSVLFGSGLRREKALWKFLERELAHPSDLPTVVLSHYPPFVDRPDEPAAYWNIEPEPRARLLHLLEQAEVRLFLSGHLHRQLVNRHDDLLLVVSTPVAFGLQASQPAVGWTLVTIPAEGQPTVEFKQLPDSLGP